MGAIVAWGAVPAFAQPAEPLPRVLIGVDGGMQATSFTFTDTRREPLFGETKTWTADYAVENSPGFGAGAAVRVWNRLAAGVTVSRFAAKRTATVDGQIPHPFFFNQARHVSGESERLEHAEQAVHVSAIWMIPVSRGVQLAAFAGPTFFSARRGLIGNIEYTESYPYDAVTYQAATVERVRATRTGFHVGADVAWFFTDAVGLGVVVRFARARGRFDSPASDAPLSVDLGGVQAGAGIRLGLGRRR